MDLEKQEKLVTPKIIKTIKDVECLTSIVQFENIWAKGPFIRYDLSIDVQGGTFSYGGNK